MSQFTVRVELHDAQWADYDTLHQAMEGRNFTRLISSDNGLTYQLPWAEYNGTSDLTCGEIRDIVRDVANSTGKTNSVLVTESNCRAWSGLAAVRR
jgi:hypothetical protein